MSASITATPHSERPKSGRERRREQRELELHQRREAAVAELLATTAETSIIVRHGLRWVVPYRFEFAVRAKARWFNRSLIDVLTHEFLAQDAAYYVRVCGSLASSTRHLVRC